MIKFVSSVMMMCANLTGLRNAQIANRALFLEVSMKIYPKKISIESIDWVKLTPQCGQASSNPWRIHPSREQKEKKG
jgi:hypothetical protein